MAVPPGVTAKILEVSVTTRNVSIGVKGNPPYLVGWWWVEPQDPGLLPR